MFIQNDIEYIRYNIWKELSNYEENTSKIISNIILLHQSSDYKQEYESCLLLTSQLNIIFTVLDLVFKYFTRRLYIYIINIYIYKQIINSFNSLYTPL